MKIEWFTAKRTGGMRPTQNKVLGENEIEKFAKNHENILSIELE